MHITKVPMKNGHIKQNGKNSYCKVTTQDNESIYEFTKIIDIFNDFGLLRI